METNTSLAAGLGVLMIILALIIRWKWRSPTKVDVMKLRKELWMTRHEERTRKRHQLINKLTTKRRISTTKMLAILTRQSDCGKVSGDAGGTPYSSEEEPSGPLHLMHRLCPHSNVVQAVELEQKDSLDDHLDVLTRKLAEKEGRLRLSKSKIRETQNEIENLHAIDQDVRQKYHEIMESLRTDLLCNDKECKRLQEQIEWVSQRRAELKDEVRRGHKIYGEAAAELASNLAELQKGRVESRVTEKPHNQSEHGLRHRKEPQLPRATPVGSIVIKSSPPRSTIASPVRSASDKPK